MGKLSTFLFSSALITASLTAIATPSASAESTVITCTDLSTQKTIVLKANQKNCKPLLAPAIWRILQSDSSARSGAGYANLRTCTSKRAEFSYQFVKSNCAKHQKTYDYWRTVAPVEIPLIATASARGHNSAAFTFSAIKQNADAPIAYYLITNVKTGEIDKVSLDNSGQLSLSNLSALTSYTFTIAAVSVDGTSQSSSITPVITTGAAPVATGAPTLAAPAFTLSSSSETRTVNVAATGFTISSTGGAIASFAISATPPGMSFNTSTGALSGTPTSIAGATTYTITATNASGSATRTFTLTVTSGVYAVGDTGPGGGKIFYVATTPFACGPTRAATCTYLEAAPSGWNTGSDPLRTWSQASNQNIAVNNASSPETATAQAIGWGYRNTRAIIGQGNTDPATSAAALADSYTVTISGVVYDDWFLPTRNEFLELYAQRASVGGLVGSYYWASSEGSNDSAWDQEFPGGNAGTNGKSNLFSVRPIRAF